MTEQPGLRYVVEDRVATIVFDRPERHNALTREMFRGYYDLLARADADPGVRVVVVTGAGRAFSVGADFEVVRGLSGAAGGRAGLDGGAGVGASAGTGAAAGTGGSASTGGQAGANGQAGLEAEEQTDLGHPVDLPVRMKTPVIAAVNGAAAGLGLVHALYADVRFAAADAKFTTAFSRRGLIAEYGMSWLLPRLVGVANALDLLLSARTIGAEEALGLGLVQRVVPAGEAYAAAVEYAKEMAVMCSPRSMAVIKGQVYGDLERGLGDAVRDAVGLMVESLRGVDVVEGVASFLERRVPEFPGYGG